jgi:RNA polymerase-binding transcription factor DksA
MSARNAAIDNAVDRRGGLVWNRLHSEREDICEALLKEFRPTSETEGMSNEDAVRSANWHKEILQTRLLKIDDALDRLMAGSYGNCSKCGRGIEAAKLDFDPAMAFCIDCWERQQNQNRTVSLTGSKSQTHRQAVLTCDSSGHSLGKSPSPEGVALETLAPYDTICLRTRNSDYRIFMLDPKTGRALIEGGCHFVEPVEATVNGSTMGGSRFRVGWIGIGLRIEFSTDSKIASTSPVKSFNVERCTSDEAVPNLFNPRSSPPHTFHARPDW